MTKIKLANGVILDATNVELKNGVLELTVSSDKTVEELAILFRNKTNTALITLMTENRKETGYKRGFTSFAGINYHDDGTKTIQMFQPKDVTEARLSDVHGQVIAANAQAAQAVSTANSANNQSSVAVNTANAAQESAANLETSILDTQLAVAELAEMMLASTVPEEEVVVPEEPVEETETEVEEPVVEPENPETEEPAAE